MPRPGRLEGLLGAHLGCPRAAPRLGRRAPPTRSSPGSTTSTGGRPRCASRSPPATRSAGAGDGAAALADHELPRVRAAGDARAGGRRRHRARRRPCATGSTTTPSDVRRQAGACPGAARRPAGPGGASGEPGVLVPRARGPSPRRGAAGAAGAGRPRALPGVVAPGPRRREGRRRRRPGAVPVGAALHPRPAAARGVAESPTVLETSRSRRPGGRGALAAARRAAARPGSTTSRTCT